MLKLDQGSALFERVRSSCCVSFAEALEPGSCDKTSVVPSGSWLPTELFCLSTSRPFGKLAFWELYAESEKLESLIGGHNPLGFWSKSSYVKRKLLSGRDGGGKKALIPASTSVGGASRGAGSFEDGPGLASVAEACGFRFAA